MLVDAVLGGQVEQNAPVALQAKRDARCREPMARRQLEHVIEKTDAGVHVVSSLALEAERDDDLRFLRPAVDYGAAHNTSSIAAMQRRV